MPPPIALSIPVLGGNATGDLETRPRQARRWIASLPLNVTFDSGRRLAAYIAGTNRGRLDIADRVEILGDCYTAAEKILADLDSMYACASLPLGPGPRAALGLARELWTELGVGYRIAVVESQAKSSRKQLASILHRAVQCTTAKMFAAYRSYTPVPTGTWAELHELYLAAEGLGVSREVIEAIPGANIVDEYLDALLLSLTDPYRLGQGEADRVLKLLGEYRGLATLGEARPHTPPGGHFVVPCNTDKPPKPSIGKLDDTGGPDWRLLDANPIVERLRTRHAQYLVAQAVTQLPRNGGTQAELVGKLIKLWGDPPKRTSRRDPGQHTVAISMGIDGVGHFVALQSRIDLAREDAGLRKGITMPLAPLPVDAQDEPLPIFEWDVVNESKGGLRVRRLDPTPQPIAVGEVAGIKIPGKPYWTVGVVRWVTVFDDGGMEFGLQYLGNMARAVCVKAWGSPSATGLLLGNEDKPAALLTVPNAYSHLQQLELEEEGDSCMVNPAQVLEVTHRFELFVVTTD